jgi:hypothetical protein
VTRHRAIKGELSATADKSEQEARQRRRAVEQVNSRTVEQEKDFGLGINHLGFLTANRYYTVSVYVFG